MVHPAHHGYDAALATLAEQGLREYSCAFLLMGFTMLGASVFTALEKGLVSAAIAFVHTFVFEIGCVIALPLLLGPQGIWWSIVVAEAAATVMVLALLTAYARPLGLAPGD